MNDKTRGTRLARRTGALALAAAAALLTTACGVVHVHFGNGSSGGGSAITIPASATYQQKLAFAQCMRAHGLSDFPNPDPPSNSGASWHVVLNVSGLAAQANDACKHLLTAASTHG